MQQASAGGSRQTKKHEGENAKNTKHQTKITKHRGSGISLLPSVQKASHNFERTDKAYPGRKMQTISKFQPRNHHQMLSLPEKVSKPSVSSEKVTCELCGLKLTNMNKLRLHKRKVHEKSKAKHVKCNFCDKTFLDHIYIYFPFAHTSHMKR